MTVAEIRGKVRTGKLMFFSFDGIDGVGKSTQMTRFCDWLGSQGHGVVACRDPGSTPLGEKIRQIVLTGGDELPIGLRSEMLLYMAARAALVAEVIHPALAAGKIVVSDRYLLANIAYQGYAGGLDVEAVRAVGAVATEGILPDCVFLLDMHEGEATRRLNRDLDRMEQRGAEYRQRLRQGFLAEAQRDRRSIHVVDAGRPIEVVEAEIRRIASDVLKLPGANCGETGRECSP